MGENCDTYASVDFGHGPVEIRCTQTGEHQACRCDVFIPNSLKTKNTDQPKIDNHRNIFEESNAEPGI